MRGDAQHLSECDRCAAERRRLAVPARAARQRAGRRHDRDALAAARGRGARPLRQGARAARAAPGARGRASRFPPPPPLTRGPRGRAGARAPRRRRRAAYARAELWSMPAGGARQRRRGGGGQRARACKLRADHLPVGAAPSTSSGACAPTAAGSTAAASTRAPMARPPRSSPPRSGRASTTWSWSRAAPTGGTRGAEVMRGKLNY